MKIKYNQLTDMNACEMGKVRYMEQMTDLGLPVEQEINASKLVGGANTDGDLVWLMVRKLDHYRVAELIRGLLSLAIAKHEKSGGAPLPQIIHSIDLLAKIYDESIETKPQAYAEIKKASEDIARLGSKSIYSVAAHMARFLSLGPNTYLNFRIAAAVGVVTYARDMKVSSTKINQMFKKAFK
ncbi:MAG: hypothetical protein Unbinned6354contig1000_39 [Prokaryotic dsDNA virus sp.]|nr:hypothetical protein [Cytophagaceae bacterium]QDP54336.1 MAG: hypothetical protein Unbinned6354contig1000_39 [Prokaryotic dsDNA virus sp.]|tara:strand:- start:1324 stop:1872 length:549 start_codon:yes stop_codon:yes gene_type:complete